MPQRFFKLKSAIAEVERELESDQTLDARTRQLLEEALVDLRAALDRQGGPGPFEPESFIEKLRSAEEEFQVSHPNLSSLVGRMVDTLGQLGI